MGDICNIFTTHSLTNFTMFIEFMFMEFMFMEFEDSVDPFDELELFGVSTGWWTLHGCSLFFTIRHFNILKPSLFLAKTVQKLCIKLPCFDYFSNCMFCTQVTCTLKNKRCGALMMSLGFSYLLWYVRNRRYVHYLQNVGISKIWLNHFVSINLLIQFHRKMFLPKYF